MFLVRWTLLRREYFLGNKHSPIEEELMIIEKYIKIFNKFVILIDDFRLFKNYETSDVYPNNFFLIDWVRKNNCEFTIEADIFIISNKLN